MEELIQNRVEPVGIDRATADTVIAGNIGGLF
jgi:hypothetical protein